MARIARNARKRAAEFRHFAPKATSDSRAERNVSSHNDDKSVREYQTVQYKSKSLSCGIAGKRAIFTKAHRAQAAGDIEDPVEEGRHAWKAANKGLTRSNNRGPVGEPIISVGSFRESLSPFVFRSGNADSEDVPILFSFGRSSSPNVRHAI